MLAVVQHFEYMNNTAYEFGSQSLGAALLVSLPAVGPFHASGRRVDGVAGLLLAGINSEYSHLADVPNQERLREYDYGPGLGASGDASLLLSGRPLLSAVYRFDWVSVSNGSVYDIRRLVGLDANHYIQAGGVRLVDPRERVGFGIGGDAYLFLRDSDFTFTDSVSGREKVRARTASATRRRGCTWRWASDPRRGHDAVRTIARGRAELLLCTALRSTALQERSPYLRRETEQMILGARAVTAPGASPWSSPQNE